jgi:hypothetical protein
MRRRLSFVLAAAIMLAGLGGLAWGQSASEVRARIEQVHGNEAAFKAGFEALQYAVTADDRETVAALMKYPFRLTIGGERSRITSDTKWLARYDEVMTPEIKAVILDQAYDTLLVTEDGVMLGNGEVWMVPVCAGRRCQQTVWLVSAITID